MESFVIVYKSPGPHPSIALQTISPEEGSPVLWGAIHQLSCRLHILIPIRHRPPNDESRMVSEPLIPLHWQLL